MNNHKLQLNEGFTIHPGAFNKITEVVDLLNLCSMTHLGINETTHDEIKNEWQSPGFNPSADTRLVYSPEEELVGYIEVWMTAKPPVHPWAMIRIHPDFVNHRLGTELLEWAILRAQGAINEVPDGIRVSLRMGTISTINYARDLYEKADMKLIRHAFRMIIDMETPPPTAIWPEGITLKQYDPGHDAVAVYYADVEAFRDHFGYVEESFEEGFQRFMHFLTQSDSYDPSLWFLAMDGDEIAGVSICSSYSHEDPDSGYINSLSVRRPWRKRGIATALMLHSFGEFYQRGKKKVMLGVDADNLTGALRLYEKVGMRVLRRFDIYEKELRPGKEISTTTLSDE